MTPGHPSQASFPRPADAVFWRCLGGAHDFRGPAFPSTLGCLPRESVWEGPAALHNVLLLEVACRWRGLFPASAPCSSCAP